MRSVVRLLVAALALAACSQAPTGGDSTTAPAASGDTSACTGVEPYPPGEIIIVGLSNVSVPMDTFECHGYNADWFRSPEDHSAATGDGQLAILFEHRPGTTVAVRAWLVEEGVEQSIPAEITGDHATLALPRPGTWWVGVRIVTADERRAGYRFEARFAPAGSAR